MSIRILLVDDHPVFRMGMKMLLSQEKDFIIVGEASNCPEAIKAIKSFESPPDVILMDISMPGINGLDAIPRILNHVPDAKIIILSAFQNEEYVLNAIWAGAYSYLVKDNSSERIIEVIREVNDGYRILDREQVSSFIANARQGEKVRASNHVELSDREIELLKHLADGESYEEIAQHMFLSIPTVKRNVNIVISKMMVKNRVQAVAEAIKDGLI